MSLTVRESLSGRLCPINGAVIKFLGKVFPIPIKDHKIHTTCTHDHLHHIRINIFCTHYHMRISEKLCVCLEPMLRHTSAVVGRTMCREDVCRGGGQP